MSTRSRSSMMTWKRPWPNFVQLSKHNLKGARMLDELKEEGIVNKIGGRFKLSTLIQKRMIMLNTGARPLVDVRGGDKLQTVIQEILQDKIYLDASAQVQPPGLSAHDPAPRAILA